jgi:hypothetical protein
LGWVAYGSRTEGALKCGTDLDLAEESTARCGLKKKRRRGKRDEKTGTEDEKEKEEEEAKEEKQKRRKRRDGMCVSC